MIDEIVVRATSAKLRLGPRARRPRSVTFYTTTSVTQSVAATKGALVSICHAAGPLPALHRIFQEPLIRSLGGDIRKILALRYLGLPRAIVVFMAHWQTKQPTINTSRATYLDCDDFAFPPEEYDIDTKRKVILKLRSGPLSG